MAWTKATQISKKDDNLGPYVILLPSGQKTLIGNGPVFIAWDPINLYGQPILVIWD